MQADRPWTRWKPASGPVESDPSIRSVGLGGAPNLLGRMECDASIMEGHGRQSGSVAAVGNCLHVISLARAVMG